MQEILLDAHLTSRINEFCQKHQMTRFAFMMGIFKIILMRIIKEDDITIGIPTAGRGHKGLENMIGVFLNVMVLRTKIAKEQSFKDYLSGLKANLTEAQDHQDYPYESLYAKARELWNFQHNSLFSILFNYMPYQEEEGVEMAGISIRPYPLKEVEPKYGLTLYVNETKELIALCAVFNNDLDAQLIDIMLRSFPTVIETVLDNEEIQIKGISLVGEIDTQQFADNFDMEFDNDDFF